MAIQSALDKPTELAYRYTGIMSSSIYQNNSRQVKIGSSLNFVLPEASEKSKLWIIED